MPVARPVGLHETVTGIGVVPPAGRAESQFPPELVVTLVVKLMAAPLLVTCEVCDGGAVPPLALKVRLVGFTVSVVPPPPPDGVNVKALAKILLPVAPARFMTTLPTFVAGGVHVKVHGPPVDVSKISMPAALSACVEVLLPAVKLPAWVLVPLTADNSNPGLPDEVTVKETAGPPGV